MLTIIGIVISLGADFGGAKNQLEQWGILPNFASRKDGEALIVIATFYRSDGVIDTEPHKKIKKAIEVAADEIGYTHLRVEVDPQILPEGDISKAIELGSNCYYVKYRKFGEVIQEQKLLLNSQLERPISATCKHKHIRNRKSSTCR